MQKVIFLVLSSEGLLGGLGVWSLRMSLWTRGRLDFRWVTFVLCHEAIEDQTRWMVRPDHPNVEKFVYDSRDKKGLLLQRLVARLVQADIVLPNAVQAAWEACSRLKQEQARLSVIGICAVDDESFYRLIESHHEMLDGTIAVSNYCGDGLRWRLGPERLTCEVLPYGVEVPEGPATKPSPLPVRLLYLGRLAQERKRVLLLPELCRILRERGVDFTLGAYGAGLRPSNSLWSCAR
jgi:glycosyltransferase involved in cell wall biosynthesis